MSLRHCGFRREKENVQVVVVVDLPRRRNRGSRRDNATTVDAVAIVDKLCSSPRPFKEKVHPKMRERWLCNVAILVVEKRKKKNVRAVIVQKLRFEVDESLFRVTKRICVINRHRRPHLHRCRRHRFLPSPWMRYRQDTQTDDVAKSR